MILNYPNGHSLMGKKCCELRHNCVCEKTIMNVTTYVVLLDSRQHVFIKRKRAPSVSTVGKWWFHSSPVFLVLISLVSDAIAIQSLSRLGFCCKSFFWKNRSFFQTVSIGSRSGCRVKQLQTAPWSISPPFPYLVAHGTSFQLILPSYNS